MNDNLKDILTNLNKDIEQDKLLQYLNKELQQPEQHAVEENMNDDEFMSDAMDGLQQFDNKNAIPAIVTQLNSSLKKQLGKRNNRKKNTRMFEQAWVYYSIILLLIIIIVAYVIIKKMHV